MPSPCGDGPGPCVAWLAMGMAHAIPTDTAARRAQLVNEHTHPLLGEETGNKRLFTAARRPQRVSFP